MQTCFSTRFSMAECFYNFTTIKNEKMIAAHTRRNAHIKALHLKAICRQKHDSLNVCLFEFSSLCLLRRHLNEVLNVVHTCHCGHTTIYLNASFTHRSTCNKSPPGRGKFAQNCALNNIHPHLAEFSAPFESFLKDDGQAARAHMHTLFEYLGEKLPASSAHQNNIHYVYVFYDAEKLAETPLEFAHAVRYIGLGERDRYKHHIFSAEEKKKLGQEVGKIIL